MNQFYFYDMAPVGVGNNVGNVSQYYIYWHYNT